ncbi:MAG: DUF1648 domain-containing protein [Bacteroidales bacterium]
MERRPRIKIEMTTADKIVEIIGWLALLTVWALTITSYSDLPDIIPTHYNGAGEIDGFGSKVNILILPLIATFFFVGITILNKFPHIFNYPRKINKDNALRQYTYMTKMNRYLKLVFVIVFGLLAYKTIQNTGGLGSWFLPLTMGLFIIPMTYFVVKSFMIKS